MKPRDSMLAQAAKHHSVYVAYAFGLIKNWSRAEDVVQEAYLAMADKWESFDQGKSIFPWAKAIVRNKSFECIRENNKLLTCSNNELEEAIASQLDNAFDDGEAETSLHNNIKGLGGCFKSLNQQSQRLLYEFYVLGHSCKEIAQKHGQENHSPVNQLCRLRSRLRKCMSSESGSSNDVHPLTEDQEKLLDNFFSNAATDPAVVKNLLKPDGDAPTPFITYVQDRTIFAFALKELYNTEQKEPDTPFQLIEPPESNTIVTKPGTLKTDFQSKKYPMVGIAAMLSLCLGLWYATQSGNPSSIATLSSVEGSILLKKANEQTPSPITSEGIIQLGDSIQLDANARCEVKYIGENTSVTLSENTVLVFEQPYNTEAKHLHLEIGELIADVDRQPEGAPMLIKTPHAEITVLGTKFRLQSTPNSTALFLHSGRAMFRAKNLNKQKTLQAGENISIQGDRLVIGSGDSLERPSSSIASPPIHDNSSLIGLFHFDEGEGQKTLATNGKMVGIMNSTIPPGKAWLSGKFGYALNFPSYPNEPGIRNIVSFPSFPYREIIQSFTLSMWLNPQTNEKQKTQKDFFNLLKCTSEKPNDGWILMLLKNPSGHRLSLKIHSAEGKKQLNSKTFLPTDTWNHVAVTFHSGKASIYINGNLDNTESLGANEITYNDRTSLSMGSRTQMTPATWIDEFAIFSRDLAPYEIADLYTP